MGGSFVKNYFNEKTGTVASVWYHLLDDKNKIISRYDGQACFAGITSYTIPAAANTIHIFHKKNLVPYASKEVARWISDLNDMDFPISFLKDDESDQYNFEIKLNSYQYKAHLMSSLMLLRALWERGICKVPK